MNRPVNPVMAVCPARKPAANPNRLSAFKIFFKEAIAFFLQLNRDKASGLMVSISAEARE